MTCRAMSADGRACMRNHRWFGTHVWAPVVELGPVVDEPDAERLFPFVVRAAAQGRCETAWTLRPTEGWVCTPGTHDGHIAHALYPDDLEAGIYDPRRAVWICRDAYTWIVTHSQAAHECGLLDPDVTQ